MKILQMSMIPGFISEMLEKRREPKIIQWIRLMEACGLPVSEGTYVKAMMEHSEYFPPRFAERKVEPLTDESFGTFKRNHLSVVGGRDAQKSGIPDHVVSTRLMSREEMAAEYPDGGEMYDRVKASFNDQEKSDTGWLAQQEKYFMDDFDREMKDLFDKGHEAHFAHIRKCLGDQPLYSERNYVAPRYVRLNNWLRKIFNTK